MSEPTSPRGIDTARLVIALLETPTAITNAAAIAASPDPDAIERVKSVIEHPIAPSS